MWSMVKHSIVLFLRGKLFADPGKVYPLVALGSTLTAVVLIGAVKAGAPPWLAAGLAGFIGGALQPYLFRNLRYR